MVVGTAACRCFSTFWSATGSTTSSLSWLPTARELPGEDRPDVNPMLIKIAREESRLFETMLVAARPKRGREGGP